MLSICAPTAVYQRHQPTDTVLYRTVEAHLETFLAHTAGDGERSGLPGFVKHLCRYLLRPPLVQDPARLRAAVKLKAAWRDGTTHLVGPAASPYPRARGRPSPADAARWVPSLTPPVPAAHHRGRVGPGRLRPPAPLGETTEKGFMSPTLWRRMLGN
jgi:hypothetical protein